MQQDTRVAIRSDITFAHQIETSARCAVRLAANCAAHTEDMQARKPDTVASPFRPRSERHFPACQAAEAPLLLMCSPALCVLRCALMHTWHPGISLETKIIIEEAVASGRGLGLSVRLLRSPGLVWAAHLKCVQAPAWRAPAWRAPAWRGGATEAPRPWTAAASCRTPPPPPPPAQGPPQV